MEIIYELLHAFGAGIAFFTGLVIGASICILAIKEERKKVNDDVKKHFVKQIECLNQISVHLGDISKK